LEQIMIDSGDRNESVRVAGDSTVGSGEFRLPGSIRLGAVKLQVADLDRSLDYYRSVLGLHELGRSGSSAKLGVGDGTSLVELHERRGAVPVPRRGRLGLFHFAVLLPDRQSLGRFITHLASVGIRHGASDHLVSEALYLNDPDGLGIEVYADRPRSEWRCSGGQIEMDTLPLDIASLIRAAGDEPWAGVPSGTRMGHVHLHVGEIESAADFYHLGLGLDKVVWSYSGALFMSAGGYHHHLGVNTWAAGAMSAGEGDARLLEWEIVLPDAETVAHTTRSLLARGYQSQPLENGASLVRDPWGTAVRLTPG